jgi:prepilin-type processing-associated H-X9-DG protein
MVFRLIKEQADPFSCPSDLKPVPIAPWQIKERRAGYIYPTVTTDSAYFAKSSIPGSDGAYQSGFETEADVAGGDRTFSDAFLYVKPDGGKARRGSAWVKKAGTGRELDLLDWRGRVMAANFSGETQHFQTPILWGSFGMNLSVAYSGFKPQHALYADYNDWSAVTESKLGVYSSISKSNRADNIAKPTAEAPQLRHNSKANVGFLDSHVELLGKAKLTPPANEMQGSIWHPTRAAGWNPASETALDGRNLH